MSKFGAGIVGSGWVSGEHISAYNNNPDTEIVALCGRTKEKAQAKLDECGIKAVALDNYEEMLKRDDIQIISICTPNDLHPQEAIAAAQAGKHIALEKPIALNLPDLKAIQEAVNKSGVKTVVSFVLHWNPLFDIIRKLLKQEAIGKIFFGEVDYFHGIGPWYKQYFWNVKQAVGGSSLLSAGCHALDALHLFMGRKKMAQISAYSCRSDSGPFKDYEYDPTEVMIIKFADGSVGKVASSLECVQPYVFNINLVGTQGTIKNNLLYSKNLMPGQTSWAKIPTIMPDSGDVTHHPFQGEIDHLVDCIKNNKTSDVDVNDAYKTHEAIFAADLSVKEGRAVDLPLK